MSNIPQLETRLQESHYQDGPYTVFTERAHLDRGSCCGNQCRHCPYEPQAIKGNQAIRPVIRALIF